MVASPSNVPDRMRPPLTLVENLRPCSGGGKFNHRRIVADIGQMFGIAGRKTIVPAPFDVQGSSNGCHSASTGPSWSVANKSPARLNASAQVKRTGADRLAAKNQRSTLDIAVDVVKLAPRGPSPDRTVSIGEIGAAIQKSAPSFGLPDPPCPRFENPPSIRWHDLLLGAPSRLSRNQRHLPLASDEHRRADPPRR